MTERDSGSDSEKQPRLPFSETRRLYREGVENLIRPMLDDPDSELSRQLDAGEPAFVDARNEVRKGRTRLIPIALPIDYKPEKGRPENAHNMTQVYLNGAGKLDETLQEVGEYYSATRQAVEISVKRAVYDVYPLFKDDIITFESLNFMKPLLDSSKDKISVGQGGSLLKVRQLVQGGADYRTLRSEFGVGTLINARRGLSKRQQKVNVPYSPDWHSWRDTIGVLTDPEVDRAVKRELIKEIDIGTYQRYSKNGDDVAAIFVDLTGVAREAGFYPRSQKGDSFFIAEYLDSRSIPLGEVQQVIGKGQQKGKVQNYRFILFVDREEAKDILKYAEGERFDQMRKPKVIYFGSVPEKLPNTYELQKKGEEYQGVFSLLAEFGVTSTKQLAAKKLTLSDLIQDSPVTVFKIRRMYRVPRQDVEELKEYLGSELRRRRVIE